MVNDPVKQELANLSYGFNKPPRTMGGVSLDDVKNDQGQTAYDRYQELHHIVSVGNKTLPDALKDLVASPRYKSLPQPDGQTDEYNGRVQAIRSTIGRYRELAQRQMLKEFPQVGIQQRQITDARRAAQSPTPQEHILQKLASN